MVIDFISPSPKSSNEFMESIPLTGCSDVREVDM